MDRLDIYTDGGARGNPGPAAIGIVFYSNNAIVKKYAAFIGAATNNQAEYTALAKALAEAKKITNGEIKCFLDSELVVRQLNGKYKVKDKKLLPLYEKIIEASHDFLSVSFHHITREKNCLADELVNRALDNRK